MIVGVDVGGTFTDVVAFDGTAIATTKVPTTEDQSAGVVAGATELADSAETFLLGTTIATNTLLERTGARTALVTDEGFEDVIEIGRQDRPALYDPFSNRAAPLVGPGDRHSPPNLDLAGDVESVAVCLLNSFRDATGEREIASALAERGISISLSSEVAPEFREFERTSTTVLNAYLSPRVAEYLRRAGKRLEDYAGSVSVMRSSGGLMSLGEAALLPAAVLLSGPAGGAVAAAALGEAMGIDVIAFDMGGTSTDVCRIEGGAPEIQYERAIDGYACRLPSAAVHTVGAGGGSVGWVDTGGALRVGPQSAGADPGPACYRRGGEEATVTDANVALGRISASAELGGRLAIDRTLAVRAADDLGRRAGLTGEQSPLGIIRVVEEVMTGAIRTVSIEQGADPRHSWLVAFGGAGGLHATALARNLAMQGVLVPPHGGVFSALGLLLSPPRVDLSRSVLLGTAAGLDKAIAALSSSASERLPGSNVETLCDARYAGQSHELTITYRAGEGWDILAARFNALHAERNGFSRPDDPIEVVTIRAVAKGVAPIGIERLPSWRPSEPSQRRQTTVVTSEGPRTATAVRREGLSIGERITGPAVVEEREATTYLDGGETAVVLDNGTLEVTW